MIYMEDMCVFYRIKNNNNNSACVKFFAKSNIDEIESGVPSSMRTYHKYNIM